MSKAKSNLNRADQYQRDVICWRLARILCGRGATLELRVETDHTGWDDFVEFMPDGKQHCWQVKKATATLRKSDIVWTIQCLARLPNVVGHFAVQDLVHVPGVGSLRTLRTLTDTLQSASGAESQLDVLTWQNRLTRSEIAWKSLVEKVLAELQASEEPISLLRRLKLEVLNSPGDIRERAIDVLATRFAAPELAWDRLRTIAADQGDGSLCHRLDILKQQFLDLDVHPERRWDDMNIETLFQRMIDNSQPPRVDVGLLIQGCDERFEQLLGRIAAGPMLASLSGPSGIGKTRLLRSIANSLSGSGTLAVLLDGRLFDGDLARWLDLAFSVDLRVEGSFRSVYSSGTRILLLVDRLDDPSLPLDTLVAGLRSLVANRGVSVILAAQRTLTAADYCIEVLPPSLEAKLQIARNVKGFVEDAAVRRLFDVLNTPLEIELASECAGDFTSLPNAYTLFATYFHRTAERLSSPQLFRYLGALAHAMREIPASRLSERLARELSDASAGNPLSVGLKEGMFVREGTGIAFRHDRLLEFADATHLVAFERDPARLAALVSSPRHPNTAAFVMGSLSDEHSLYLFICHCESDEVLTTAWSGELGRRARDAVRMRWTRILDGLRSGIGAAISAEQDADIVSINSISSTADLALARAVGLQFAKGDEIAVSTVLAISRYIDEHWQAVRSCRPGTTLRERELFFHWVYVLGANPLCSVASVLVRWHQNDTRPGKCLPLSNLLLSAVKLTPHELYFVCKYTALAPETTEPTLFARLFRHAWNSRMNHVRLAACDALSAYELEGLSEEAKRSLAAALKPIWDRGGVLWGPMEEVGIVLARLGAITPLDEGLDAWVAEQIAQALDESAPRLLAHTAYRNQFEAHIGGPFCEAIAALPESQRLELLMRAAEGAPRDEVTGPAILLGELIDIDDPRVVSVALRWASVPVPRTMMAGDDAGAFMAAHKILARCDVEPPTTTAADPESIAFSAFGQLIWELNRRGGKPEVAWRRLLEIDAAATLSVFLRARMSHWLPEARSNDPLKSNPEAVVEIAIRGLRSLASLSREPWDGVAKFAIQSLARFHAIAAAGLLRSLVDHPTLGQDAATALRQLEAAGGDLE